MVTACNIYAFEVLDIDVVGGDSIIHFDADNCVTVLDTINLTGSDFLFA